MNRPIEQALTSLIPAYNGPLPVELVSLTTSLLAQSRGKASNLKHQEEIARTYVCANLACERLKRRLQLPQIQPRPPCPPRTYKKVYKLIETALAQTVTQSPAKTQRSTGREAGGGTQASANGVSGQKWTQVEGPNSQRGTPSKRKAAQELPGTPAKKRKGQSGSRGGEEDEQLDDVVPLVRQLCRVFGVADAVPHVCAGVLSILKLKKESAGGGKSTAKRKRGRGPGDAAGHEELQSRPIGEREIPALVVVVLFYTWMRMTGKPISSREYGAKQRKAVDTILQASDDDNIRKEDLIGDIEHFMREEADSWMEMEWYANIPSASDAGREERELSESEEALSDEHDELAEIDAMEFEDGQGMLQSGLCTMMQPALEYLSAERRRDYARWKVKMMARIKQMQTQQDAVEA